MTNFIKSRDFVAAIRWERYALAHEEDSHRQGPWGVGSQLSTAGLRRRHRLSRPGRSHVQRFQILILWLKARAKLHPRFRLFLCGGFGSGWALTIGRRDRPRRKSSTAPSPIF